MMAPRNVKWPGGNQHRSVARDSSNPIRNSLCCENATVDISNKGIKKRYMERLSEVQVKVSIV
jgi:hypothetical protein